MKRSVKVDVAGSKYSLRTDADEDYVRSLAKYVTDKLAEARSGSGAVATQSLVVLAAMQIADELFQARRQADEFRSKVRDLSVRALSLLEKEEGTKS
jgi:cell division protein ZapA